MSDEKHPPIPPTPIMLLDNDNGWYGFEESHGHMGFVVRGPSYRNKQDVVICTIDHPVSKAVASYFWRKIDKEEQEKYFASDDPTESNPHFKASLQAKRNWLAWDSWGEKENE